MAAPRRRSLAFSAAGPEVSAQMPALGGPQPVPPPNVAIPSPTLANPGQVNVGRFNTPAPVSTPYGDFSAPDPAAVASDPYYQFRLGEGLKAREKSAAARGTLLTGGTLKGLEGYAQGLASEEAGKGFDRSLAVYDTNRATNAQNFGQNMSTFQGNLGAFGANTSAALGEFGANTGADLNATRLNNDAALDVYDRSLASAGQQQAYEQDVAATNYAQWVAAQRANALANAQQGGPQAPWPGRIKPILKMRG